MNYRASFTFLFSLLAMQSGAASSLSPSSAPQTSFVTDVSSFPWTGTFLGINAQHTPLKPVSGPFQASPLPQSLEPATNNPFYVAPSSVSTQTTQSTAQSIVQLLGNSSTPTQQKINATFVANTTVDGAPMKITPQTKYRVPPTATAVSNLGLVSFTQLQKQIQKPQQPLFPGNQNLASAYQNFMDSMQATPSFLPLFRKLHIIALHEIYIYLTGIYTALNMTHIDDLKTYTLTVKKYALNKKTLIINHLINVIMAQLSQALRALMPGLPESYAIHSGMICMQNDQLSDPNFFILDLEKSVLAVLGLKRISSAKLIATYNALISYSNLSTSSDHPKLLTITTGSDLWLAMQQLKSSSFSAKLPKAQATALVTALDTIVAYMVNQQSISSLQVILDNLLGTPSASTPTTQQAGQFAKFITQCVYGGPLEQEIAAAQTFATLLGNETEPASRQQLTQKQLTLLRGILSYILQRYETIAAQETTKLIQVLGEFNPTYQVLSPSQALTLKTIAQQMLPSSPTAPPTLLLQNLTDTQRANLAYGLWVTSNTTPSFSSAQVQSLQSLAISLKQGPMSEESLTTSQTAVQQLSSNALSSDQQTVLQKALSLLARYELTPLTSADFEEETQKNLKTLSLPEQDEQADIAHALSVMTSPNFHSFDQLTPEEQVVLLKLFQKVDQVFETRLQHHTQQATEIAYLLADNTTAQNNLFSSITSGQYEALNAIDAFLETATKVSFNDIAQITPPPSTNPQNQKSWMDPKTALLRLFTVPISRNTQAPPPVAQIGGTSSKTLFSYLSILLQLQTEHFQNQPLLSILPTLKPATIAAYRQVLPIITNPNFAFSQLSPSLKQSLAQTVQSYIHAIEQSKTTMPKGRAPLSNPNESALETVANVVRFTDIYTTQKQEFLWTLKQYLLFFNLYAQTLQNISNDPSQPPYTGLTEFATYAQNIQQALNYTTGTKEELAQLISQTNPPLFFYNAPVFRGIRLLPKLALLVENSSIAPFPTFGIEQATSPTGTALDPLTNQPVSNMNTVGDFQYQKFFFLEAPDTTTEHTGALPSWISKVPSLSSKATQPYLYEPNNIPQDGITGFYMNIPTFESDPTNAQAALLRLYQQPIIAQPLWLNKSGTGSNIPLSGIIPAASAGAVTVLRGCLGDFQAILDLGIFDPCLTIIFKTALSLENATKPITTPLFTSAETQACAAYLTEKQAALSNNPVTKSPSTSSSPETSEGATIMLPGANQ